MIIRKAQKEDMKAVLELIQELATFEKEPDAVVVTVEDLVRDGFGDNPLFYCFVGEMEVNSSESELAKQTKINTDNELRNDFCMFDIKRRMSSEHSVYTQ